MEGEEARDLVPRFRVELKKGRRRDRLVARVKPGVRRLGEEKQDGGGKPPPDRRQTRGPPSCFETPPAAAPRA